MSRLRRAGIAAAVVLVLLLVGSAVFEFVAGARDRRRFPPVGQLVDAGGYRLHIYCSGTGSPAVIFESGFGMTLNAWALVQPSVAELTRACSYDRPGYGWSDEPPDPRTGKLETADLHRALSNAGIPGPYVLAGHSMGGGQVRLFASRYPNDVAGMVIVASGHEDWRTRNPPAVNEDIDAVDRFIQAAAVLSRVGVSRLIGALFHPAVAEEYAALLRKYLPPRVAESEVAYLAQPKHIRAMAEETRATSETEAQLRTARDFGDMPLIVLSERWDLSPQSGAKEKEAARVEDELQGEMARFSRNGRQIRVDSGHLIPLEKPAVVIDAVREVVTLARARRGR
jgi:pimeloyl-ACP methyl ester carboxylesterase